MKLPEQMRKPRKARPLANAKDAWYYVNPRTIDIFTQSHTGSAPACKLTRRQLRQALAIMSKC